MKNLTFKAAMLKGSRPTVNRRSADGQSQRHCKQTPLSKRWKVLMTLVFLFTSSIGNVWGAISKQDVPSSTFTCGTTAGFDTYFYTFSADANNSDTVVFSAYDSYNSSITWASYTGDVKGSSASWKDQLYAAASNTTLVDRNATPTGLSHKVYNSGNYYIVRSTRTLRYLVTNCTGVSISGYISSSKTLYLKAYVVTSGTPAASAVKTAEITSSSQTTTSIDGLTASNTYLIELSGSADDNKHFICEVAFIYPHAASCSEPAAPTISGTASYTEGETITLEASHDGSNHGDNTTYQWFKGATFATATSVQAAATGATGYTFSKTAALSDDGSVYWCEAANGTCKSHNEPGKTIAVSASSAAKHAISYNEESLKGQSVSGYPTEYTEGVGIASFDDLADVTNFHFNGWSPASISASATTDVELTATWVDAYNVTFSYGAGGGTVPTSFQKWEGAKFNLPGQGSMTAPEGKAFDGWKANGTGDKLAANAEYTMGNAAVEFVAQWKNTPTVLFHYQWSGSSTAPTSNEALTATGGTFTFYKSPSSSKDFTTASVTYHTGVSSDMKTVAGTSDRLVTLNSTSNNSYLVTLTGNKYFEEGDTVFFAGYGNFRVGTTHGADDIVAASSALETGSGASDVNVGYFIFPELENNVNTLYFTRDATSGNRGFTAVKVIRPAARPSSTVISLSDLKVNNRSISSDSLTTLVSAKSLLLKDEYAVAPVIKFNEHKVITYSDELLPATKVTDKVHTVTATLVDGNWQAQATINAITYTVTAPKQSSAKVTYYDGETKIGEETVGIGGNPAEYADYQDKDFATFVGWYSNADLADEHAIDIAALTVGADKAVYGKWTPAYASSINIEQWVLDNGAGKGNNKVAEQTAAFITAMTGLNYKCADLNELDSLRVDKNDGDRNEPYLGIKWKKASSQISFLLKSGSKVRVKLGNIGSGVDLIIDEDAAIPKDASFEYENTTGADVIVTFKGKGTSTLVLKQIMIDDAIATVKLPAVVTYDANGGTFGKTTEKYTGTPLVIADATPADAAYEFEGWHVGTVEGAKINAAAYEPAKDITLVAKYVVKPSPFSLTALTYTIGAGEAQNVGYVEGTYTYTVELPYAGSYENITVAATLKEAGSSIVDDATKVMTVTSLPGAATFTVSDGAEGTQLYTINFKKGAKDGVCIIKGNVGNDTFVIDEDASLFAGTADKNNVRQNSSTYQEKIGWKFQARPARLGLTLSGDETFQEGDVVEVFVTSVANIEDANDKMRIFDANVATAAHMLYESEADMIQGANRFVLPATTTKSLYLHRTNDGAYDNFNPFVAYVAVYRPMMPELTAITINGVACVKGEGNTFAVTLPEEGTNFASLTIVPTIIRNAAHATTPEAVISNEGAWKAGDNTYRVMDKDGDYTDYTITITLQGQAPAPDITTQPAGVAYCAGSEPTLTVEATGNELHYAWFKEAGETDEAVGTDAASYTVEAAGTYYVIITNHVDGKLDKSITSANAVVTLNTAAAITKQPTNKRDIALNSEVTLSVEATNATSYQWYSCEDAEKHGAAAISGAEAANYVFTCNANCFYYCVVGNACGEDLISDVVSVKLEPEGCNTFASKPAASPYNYTQAGEWTFYFVDSNGADKSTDDNVFEDGKNFDDEDVVVANTRRFALKFEKDVESVTLYGVGGNDKLFEKVSVSDEMKKNTYTELTATATKTDLTSQQHIYTIEDMIIPAGKYAWFELSGSLKFFKICYTAALVEPKLPTLVNQELCAGADYETFNATITNAAACEGTVSYKWYETTDTENPVAETAEFTPGADGTYYVVVKHAAAGHATRVAQSANLTVAHFAAPALESYSEDVFQHMGTEATLSVTATGSGLAYAWYTCDAEGNNAVAVDPAVNAASMHIASVAEGVRYYKVAISNTCDATTLSHIFKVEGWNQLEQVDVTATTTWDMTNVSASAINLKNEDPALNKQNVRLLLANIDGVNNNASFNSQALYFEGQHIGRTSNNVKHLAGQYVQFNVTVPGMVSVTFASNGGARTIQINGKECSRTTDDGNYIRYDVAVEPGSVEIKDVQGYVRISKIEFKAGDNYHRTVNPSYLGTLCWTNNAILGGAKLYEFQGRDAHNYLVFDEVLENRLEAGKPYIFMPENGNTEIKVYNTDNNAVGAPDDPETGIYGTLVDKDLYPSTDVDLYYFSANHIWAVKDFTVDKITIPANFCYVNYTEVLEGDLAPVNPAPGRRRVTMGVQGSQIATGMGEIEASETPMKVMIDGQLFIIRGEKMFDATGRLVK